MAKIFVLSSHLNGAGVQIAVLSGYLHISWPQTCRCNKFSGLSSHFMTSNVQM